jgi:hypothetical protein
MAAGTASACSRTTGSARNGRCCAAPCPAGGIRVAGYVTPQARYRAIRGGDYAVTREPTATTPEAGTCTLPDEPPCGALALYEGRCPR